MSTLDPPVYSTNKNFDINISQKIWLVIEEDVNTLRRKQYAFSSEEKAKKIEKQFLKKPKEYKRYYTIELIVDEKLKYQDK